MSLRGVFSCHSCGFSTNWLPLAESHEKHSGHEVWEEDE